MNCQHLGHSIRCLEHGISAGGHPHCSACCMDQTHGHYATHAWGTHPTPLCCATHLEHWPAQQCCAACTPSTPKAPCVGPGRTAGGCLAGGSKGWDPPKAHPWMAAPSAALSGSASLPVPNPPGGMPCRASAEACHIGCLRRLCAVVPLLMQVGAYWHRWTGHTLP